MMLEIMWNQVESFAKTAPDLIVNLVKSCNRQTAFLAAVGCASFYFIVWPERQKKLEFDLMPDFQVRTALESGLSIFVRGWKF